MKRPVRGWHLPVRGRGLCPRDKRGLFGRTRTAGPAPLEPVALAVHFQAVGRVGEAIEQDAGQTLGTEHLGSFIERQG